MIKAVDKVLAALGNMRAMERLHVDTFTEDKIENVDLVGEKIGESVNGQLYVALSELNSYIFLEATLLSRISIKTFNGSRLIFSGGSKDFTLKSDTQEIESEFSNVSNRHITEISFDITEEEIKLIGAKDFTNIQFEFKKKAITFQKTVNP